MSRRPMWQRQLRQEVQLQQMREGEEDRKGEETGHRNRLCGSGEVEGTVLCRRLAVRQVWERQLGQEVHL